MFERFSNQARRVLVLAQEESRLLRHDFLGTEHILLGLLREGEGVAAKALQALGISLDAVRDLVGETIPPGEPTSGAPPFTPRAKNVLELSLREALQLGHQHIGTEHILLGLAREGDGVAAQVLVSMGAELWRVREQVLAMMPSGYAARAPASAPAPAPAPEAAPGASLRPERRDTSGQDRIRNLLAVAMDAASELERLGEEVESLRKENQRLRVLLDARGIEEGGAVSAEQTAGGQVAEGAAPGDGGEHEDPPPLNPA